MNNIEFKTTTYHSMKYGAIIGVLLVINSLILLTNGINEFTSTDSGFLQNMRIFIIGFGIFFSVKHISEKILRRNIKFGEYLLIGMLTGVFFSIIDAFYFVVYTKYLDTSTIDFFIKALDELKTQHPFLTQSSYNLNEIVNAPLFLFSTMFFSDIINVFFYTLFFALFYIIFPKPKIK